MQSSSEQLKSLVQQKYSEIALQDKEVNQASCCGAGGCSTEVYNIMSDDYSTLGGYNPDADLGLGCGLPTQFAKIKKGDTRVDLGSGAGNDCFIARAVVGDQGRVIGLDMTEAMVDKARQNAAKMGFDNVEFHLGDIENMPLETNLADVVVSNCVFNLVPDKQAALAETYRILKPGGHFSISDIVLQGEIPQALQEAAEMYAGCVSGALQESDYLGIIRELGFLDITVQKRKPIVVPDDILSNYLSAEELAAFKASGTGIFSVTVFARKSSVDCCSPKSEKRSLKDLTPANPEGVHALPGCDLGSGCC